MKAFLTGVALAFLLSGPGVAPPALAETAVTAEKTYQISNAQVSTVSGLSVRVKALSVGADSTRLDLVVSFDSPKDRETAELNGFDNAFITWSDNEADRIYLRRVQDNPTLSLNDGQSMQGALVFPGVIPEGVSAVTVTFNPGRDADHPVAPGISIPLDLGK